MFIKPVRLIHPIVLLCFGVVFFNTGCSSPPKKTEEKTQETLSDQTSSIDQWNQKIKKDPANIDLYFQRAKTYLENKNKEEAIEDINRALSLDSTRAEYFIFRANIHYSNLDTRKAREDLQKAIDLEPENIEARLKLAEILMMLEKYTEALTKVDEVLKINVFHPMAYFQKGMIYKYASDTLRAISSFQTSVEQNPNLYKAYLQLGNLTKNTPQLAIEYYNNAININPSKEALYHKAYYLQELNRPKKAMQGYDLILKIDPQDYHANFNKAYLYFEYFNKPDSALMFYNTLLTSYQNDHKLWYNTGLCYEDLRENKKAINAYQKALQVLPDYTPAAQRLSALK